jgi:hypothetical protein
MQASYSLRQCALLILLVSACSETRRPGGGTPPPGTPKDSGVNEGGDTGVPNPTDTGGGVCQCDVRLGVCDPGCACDPACVPGQDAGFFDANPPFDGGPRPDSGFVGPPDTGLGPFDGGVLMGDQFQRAMRATEYATAICRYQTRCQPAIYAYTNTNETDCITDLNARLNNIWSAYDSAITAGRLAFNATAFNACVSAYGTNADCILGPDTTACDGMFRGNRPTNVACALSVECASGFCAISALGQCGSCQPFARNGEDCTQSICENGTDCFDVGGGQALCLPNNLQESAQCGTVQTGVCGGLLQCVGAMAPGTCQRPAANGATCDPQTATGPDCNIYMNQACNVAAGQMTGMCAAATFVGPGTACGTGTAFCNSQGRCDQATMMCAAWPGAGQTCFQGACADDLYCDQQGTCRATAGQGQTCMASDECSAEFFCVNSQCGPLTFNNTCN